ncbi:T9SS type A sorting domain-containing protein [Taibaiella sp. KBW10]|uniref:T9SS type A sorting domain-containing protein n=1 Tax=Taibaiella sp. KBW10 TaxID=2153357 RepID=UPI0013159D42|nr:T9SS type A sorting domain-containing protein [Taibaiella sp. KBW10]
MKKWKHFIAVGALCLMALPPRLYAQVENTERSEWHRQMAEQEQKITSFIAAQMKQSAVNEKLRREFLATEGHDEVPASEVPRMTEDYLKDHYRQAYFKQHPEAVAIYNPGRVQLEPVPNAKPTGASADNMLCNYGDFETATSANLVSQGYNGYAGATYYYYSGGLCSFIPTTSVSYLNVGFSDPNNFLVTNNIPDPNIPAINQTHNGSKHAIRINGYENCDKFGINMLQKSFSSSTTGKGRINFSYALVVQAPHSGAEAYGNAFFVARVLDNGGNEVGSRVCVSSGSAGSNFKTTDIPDCRRSPNWKVSTLWRDWDCNYIEFDAQAGKTYTIEFFVAACKWNVHYAYAYVDDICANISCCPNLPPPPANPKCVPGNNSSNLSWNPVPGAVYYKVSITTYDPACCLGPNPIGLSTVRNTSTPSLSVPSTLAHCFSWKVQAVMPDSCRTEFSDRQCSCTLPPPPPVGLDCAPGKDVSNLSWTPIPGAAYYKVSITTYDPVCCSGPSPIGLSTVRNTNTASLSVPATLARCFSWKVQAVMLDSARSLFSDSKCSCTPPIPPPVGLDCIPDPGGSNLSWAPVTGALYYKVSITTYDPACCPGSNFGLSTVRHTNSPNLFVPLSLASCFSWKVQAVMPDSSRTEFSVSKCSCSPSRPGEGRPINANAVLDHKMSVTAVPNPASEYIQFTVHDRDQQNRSNRLNISLYDISGKEVIRKEMSIEDQLRLDIHAFADGVYTYEIRSNKHILFKDKIVIEKR